MLFIFFIITIIFNFQLFSETLSVCETCSYTKISTAIEAARPGDSIEVFGGENPVGTLFIKKPISLIAKNNAVLDGEKKGHVVDIQSDGVSISGFRIKNSGMSDLFEFAGIHTEKIKNCTIKDNYMTDVVYGIYMAESTDCLVSGNFSDGNAKNEVSGGNGIHLWNSRNIKIINNKLSRHRDGLYLEFAEGLYIERNESYGSLRYGMHFMFSHGNVFFRNHFHHNPTGVAIMYSKRIEVIENRFEKNWGLNSYGILLKDITDSKFERNLFRDNTIGIYGEGSNRNKFLENNIVQNGWGMSILGNCDGNVFTRNNFIENVFHLNTNSRKDENEFKENFWDDYKGYDLNRDGIGEKVHFPVPVFGYWVAKYPFLMVLFNSPLVQFLEIAEKAFPMLIPDNLIDPSPLIKPSRSFTLKNQEGQK